MGFILKIPWYWDYFGLKDTPDVSSSATSEDSSDSSGDEKPASKLKLGQYSAVPPPLTLEAKKGKGPGVACKKIDSSEEEEEEKAEQPVAKQPSHPKSAAVTQNGESSSDSDSDSSSEEEEKKAPMKRSAKPFAAKGMAKPAQMKRVESSSDSSDSDSSEEEVPLKPAHGGKSPSVKPSSGASVTKHHENTLDEGAMNGGLIAKKRKREDDQVLETPKLKKSKVKPKTSHSFPKMKRVCCLCLCKKTKPQMKYLQNEVRFLRLCQSSSDTAQEKLWASVCKR
ncbi:PREDICTED: nucleolar and coiled-body phosphoprotein 1-like [Gekko japonicus]|uniref:Nucleolar and coiled-body phosphoprotein 1-like n=1 Tax=Gekko japonicus TaxID=146911 RepID=A0ABM1LB20_GEKJA|nr:PREDICTED: nucleolar and coiled-body phosphoprotein 1-like [Gekko japonicus]